MYIQYRLRPLAPHYLTPTPTLPLIHYQGHYWVEIASEAEVSSLYPTGPHSQANNGVVFLLTVRLPYGISSSSSTGTSTGTVGQGATGIPALTAVEEQAVRGVREIEEAFQQVSGCVVIEVLGWMIFFFGSLRQTDKPRYIAPNTDRSVPIDTDRSWYCTSTSTPS